MNANIVQKRVQDFVMQLPVFSQVPAGLAGYHPETFKKFLAFYLHGAV